MGAYLSFTGKMFAAAAAAWGVGKVLQSSKQSSTERLAEIVDNLPGNTSGELLDAARRNDWRSYNSTLDAAHGPRDHATRSELWHWHRDMVSRYKL